MAQKSIQVEGKVTAALSNTQFEVRLEDGRQIVAHIASKLRKKFIRILPGDIVTVEISGYPLNKGRIVHRGPQNKKRNQTETAEFRLIIQALVADSTDREVVRTKLVNLYRKLNEYSIARWGRGLTVEDFKQYILAGVPEEV
jgi:translation initiation factor IF-1